MALCARFAKHWDRNVAFCRLFICSWALGWGQTVQKVCNCGQICASWNKWSLSRKLLEKHETCWNFLLCGLDYTVYTRYKCLRPGRNDFLSLQGMKKSVFLVYFDPCSNKSTSSFLFLQCGNLNICFEHNIIDNWSFLNSLSNLLILPNLVSCWNFEFNKRADNHTMGDRRVDTHTYLDVNTEPFSGWDPVRLLTPGGRTPLWGERGRIFCPPLTKGFIYFSTAWLSFFFCASSHLLDVVTFEPWGLNHISFTKYFYNFSWFFTKFPFLSVFSYSCF